MKLIILNLPRDATSEELMSLFQVYGKVASIDLVMDKEKDISKP